MVTSANANFSKIWAEIFLSSSPGIHPVRGRTTILKSIPEVIKHCRTSSLSYGVSSKFFLQFHSVTLGEQIREKYQIYYYATASNAYGIYQNDQPTGRLISVLPLEVEEGHK